jgi:hypothetical protein
MWMQAERLQEHFTAENAKSAEKRGEGKIIEGKMIGAEG